jgi:hypothetical protein
MGEGQEAGEESSGLAEAPAFSRSSLFLASAVMIVHQAFPHSKPLVGLLFNQAFDFMATTPA